MYEKELLTVLININKLGIKMFEIFIKLIEDCIGYCSFFN